MAACGDGLVFHKVKFSNRKFKVPISAVLRKTIDNVKTQLLFL